MYIIMDVYLFAIIVIIILFVLCFITQNYKMFEKFDGSDRYPTCTSELCPIARPGGIVTGYYMC